MRDELLGYYERELTFLRQMGGEFAEKYPKIASRLMLEPDRCEDPHVERMLEAFAFLAARVHLKIDDDFPEITNALLGVVYPHYTRPIPSMSIAEFQLDPEQGKLSTGLKVARDSVLYSRPVDGTPCKFRTCYDTTLWPVSIAEAQWRTPDQVSPPVRSSEAAAALKITLQCSPDVSFDKLELRSLRFFLNGESNLVHSLYELLCNNCTSAMVRDASKAGSRWLPLPSGSITPVGFDEQDGVLPYPRRSFVGYRLLQEYFTVPEKFLFLDIGNLEILAGQQACEKAEILVLISPFERAERQQNLELNVSARTLRLGCSPIINLFSQSAEPISIDQTKFEFPVVPDLRRRYTTEIFSVDEVVGTDLQTRQITRFEPFYSYHSARQRQKGQPFWYVSRRPSTRRDDTRTEIYLSLVDPSSRPVQPGVETVTVRCTCTNHNLPSKLPFGNANGDFELEGGSPIRRIVALHKPTPALAPPSGKGAMWRLVSLLSLNYLSLVSEGKESLQEMLRLYNFADSVYLEKQIKGIVNVASERQFARVFSECGVSSARGTRVSLELDEEQFVGGGVYLFASVLEHFFALYASLNSFSQLVATTRQRKEALRAWPPRAGQAILM